MNKDIVIQVSGLTKRYGEILAIDHINFEVKEGEVFGFLGPNGAGKTTTIRILTGLSRSTDGNASIFGLDINSPRPFLRCSIFSEKKRRGSQIVQIKKYIGVAPEISNLYDELSAMDNLIFMAQLYGLPAFERKKRAQELLKTFRLYERKDSLFRTFSRGMKRALTIAAALIHNPKILFLDEPTVGLDVVAARSLRNLISNLRQQGITIFLTTHYLEEADLLCDRVAILVKGRILVIEAPGVLKAKTDKKSLEEAFMKITGLEPEVLAIEKGK
jgi:ABC-2 type transport system ATP-binding protein